MAKRNKSKQDVKPREDKDRQVALKAALDRIEKDFGRGAVLTLGDTEVMEVESVPTGALSLDVASTIYDAYKQLTVRYKRDIPELFKYNALCVISDGANNKMGSFFAPYEFFYSWRKVEGNEKLEKDGIDSLYTMVNGLFNKERFIDVIHNFIYFPDTSTKDEKIVPRYPQYYAANKLLKSVKRNMKPHGNGKGGTYFGATGCGKSYTMLYLTRLLMRDEELQSPTIILITDRTDLDDQLSKSFVKAKEFIGDNNIISVESRADLREKLQNRKSGGVFLTDRKSVV